MRKRKLENENSGCGGVNINLCGKTREMVLEKQLSIMKEHNYVKVDSARIERIIENILEEAAKKYFKKSN